MYAYDAVKNATTAYTRNLDQGWRASIAMPATEAIAPNSTLCHASATTPCHRTQPPYAPMIRAAAETAKIEMLRIAGLTVELSGAHADVLAWHFMVGASARTRC